jgi:type IV pilus assembly protein PilB
MLLAAGVIDDMQLQSVLAHQRKWGGRIGQCLVTLRFASEAQVVRALASKLECPVFDVSTLAPGPALDAALALVPPDLALRHCLLPVAVDAGSLTVAMADPTNVAVVDELSFRVGRRIRALIAGEDEIRRAVRRLYHGEEDLPEPAPPAAAPAPAAEAPPPLAPRVAAPAAARQAALLDALDRVARGERSALLEPERLVAALARLVLKKGIVGDVELMAELAGPPGGGAPAR